MWIPFPDKKYRIILADPPWPYDNPKSNLPRLGGKTYPTMSLEEILCLPVDEIAAEDCALFLWVTMPKLNEVFNVIEAWGFRYITCAFVWVKQNPKGKGIYSGLGHWTNGNAEICLFCKKGSPKRVDRSVKQIVLAPRGRHSAKPAEIRNRIVHLMGDLPRIELFAREHVEGWDAWGNQVLVNECES